jgi:hypothetical protein
MLTRAHKGSSSAVLSSFSLSMSNFNARALSPAISLKGVLMPQYRLYALDQEGRIRQPARLLDCETDHAAVEEARSFLDGRDAELWEGARLVHRFPKKKD